MKRRLLAAAATILLIAGSANAQSAPKPAASSDAQPLAVLLEQGIYQEETAGNLEAAAKTYHQIVEQAAVSRALVAQALGRLAALEVKQKQLDEARKTIKRLKTEYPEQKDAIAKAEAILPNDGTNPLATRYAAGGGGDHSERPETAAHVPTAEEITQAEELAKQGWQQYRDGKFKLAAEAFQRATQLNPNLIDAWNGLGWAYLSQQKPSGFYFAKALVLDPKNVLALNGMGWALWSGGDGEAKDDAVKYWQRALEADPTATSAMSGLAQHAIERSDFDEAVKWYGKWLSQDPKNADATAGLEQANQGQAAVKKATEVTTNFFKKLDDGQFAETGSLIVPRAGASYSAGGTHGRRITPRTETQQEAEKSWEDFLRQYRKPMGTTVSRKIELVETVPSITTGQTSRIRIARTFGPNTEGPVNRRPPSILLQFETNYENKRNVIEILSLQKTDAGEWKIFAYSINEGAVPRDPLKG